MPRNMPKPGSFFYRMETAQAAGKALDPGRLERARGLAVMRRNDGRILVDGKSGPYYLKDTPNSPACFCADAAQGRMECKHVLAASGEGFTWIDKGKIPDESALKRAESRKNSTLNEATLGSWILSNPKATEETLSKALAVNPGATLALGVLRFQEAVASPVMRDALMDAVKKCAATEQWGNIVAGRLLGPSDKEEAARIWTWLESRCEEIELARILRFHGIEVTRKIPPQAMVKLLASKNERVRWTTLEAMKLKATILPTLSLERAPVKRTRAARKA